MRKQNEKALEQLMKYFYRKKYSNDTIKRWVVTAVEFIAFLEKYNKTVDDIGDLLNSEGKVVQKEPFGSGTILIRKHNIQLVTFIISIRF